MPAVSPQVAVLERSGEEGHFCYRCSSFRLLWTLHYPTVEKRFVFSCCCLVCVCVLLLLWVVFFFLCVFAGGGAGGVGRGVGRMLVLFRHGHDFLFRFL